MPKLTALVNDLATVSVPFGDSALRVTYRPNAITPKFQKAVARAQRDEDLDAALLWPTSELLHSWDLTHDDGTPVPTTPDALADLPVRVILAILSAIGADMAPNPTKVGGSSNGSSPTASSAPAQTGTSS